MNIIYISSYEFEDEENDVQRYEGTLYKNEEKNLSNRKEEINKFLNSKRKISQLEKNKNAFNNLKEHINKLYIINFELKVNNYYKSDIFP